MNHPENNLPSLRDKIAELLSDASGLQLDSRFPDRFSLSPHSHKLLKEIFDLLSDAAAPGAGTDLGSEEVLPIDREAFVNIDQFYAWPGHLRWQLMEQRKSPIYVLARHRAQAVRRETEELRETLIQIASIFEPHYRGATPKGTVPTAEWVTREYLSRRKSLEEDWVEELAELKAKLATAEAERDRLREALENIIISSKWSGTPPTAYAKIARTALAKEP